MYSNKKGSSEGEAWLISLVRTRTTTRMKELGGRKEKMPRARPIATSRTSGIDWVFRTA